MKVWQLRIQLEVQEARGLAEAEVYYMGALMDWEEINNVDVEKDEDHDPPRNIILLKDQ